MSYILDLRLFNQPCAWVIWSDPCSNAIAHRLFTDCLWEKGMCNTGAPELSDLPAEDQQTNTPLTNHLCHQLISLWKNCSLHHVDRDFYPLLSRKGNPTNVHFQTVTWKSRQLCSRSREGTAGPAGRPAATRGLRSASHGEAAAAAWLSPFLTESVFSALGLSHSVQILKFCLLNTVQVKGTSTKLILFLSVVLP